MPEFDHQSYADRRAHARVPLDAPCFASIELQGESLQVLIVDCSRGGMQFALSPGTNLNEDWLGSSVRIGGLPARLDKECAGCAAVLSWMGGGRCGVRFEQPLDMDDADLASLLLGL